jgi:hypothetical protein
MTSTASSGFSKEAPMAEKMLIRRPASDVFNAFAQPEIITKIWLKSTTGPLFEGAKVEWEFMVPCAREILGQGQGRVDPSLYVGCVSPG